jgi:hypothetical protein
MWISPRVKIQILKSGCPVFVAQFKSRFTEIVKAIRRNAISDAVLSMIVDSIPNSRSIG